MTPVDVCAKACVLFMQGSAQVAHLSNPETVSVREIVAELNPDCREIEINRFAGLLLDNTRRLPASCIATVVDALESMNITGIRVKTSGEKTRQELARQGFVWTKPEISVVLKEFTLNETEAGR